MKKEIFLKKLDLLSISLEILINWHGNKKVFHKFNKLNYDLRNKKYNKKQNFIFLVEYIYHIIKLIKSYSIDRLANKIIQNDQKSIKQYISKFYYIYYRNKKYYINHKTLLSNKVKKIAVSENAILYLYIISKLKRKHGIYNLIKYLKKEE